MIIRELVYKNLIENILEYEIFKDLDTSEIEKYLIEDIKYEHVGNDEELNKVNEDLMKSFNKNNNSFKSKIKNEYRKKLETFSKIEN